MSFIAYVGQHADASPVLSASPRADTASITAEATSPFGLTLISLPEGSLTDKWHVVEQAIADDLKTLASCRDDRSRCGSPEAVRFLDIVEKASAREGVARIGEINRAINLAIRPVSDRAQYGIDDQWTSPLTTFKAGAGDCEDYAIAKLVALRQIGLASSDVKLVILRDMFTNEDHAIVAARSDGRWRLLDNRHLIMLDDSEVGSLRPIFAIDENGARRFEKPALFVTAQAPDAVQYRAAAMIEDVLTAAISIADISPEPSSVAPTTILP